MKSLLFRGGLAGFICLLVACGQRGPLYLPQPAPAAGPMTTAPVDRPVAPATETAPADQNRPSAR